MSSALTLLAPSLLCAQARAPRSGGELLGAIERLGMVGNVLYVAAHPDDENTWLLTWLANEKRVRTGYLSLTRGEGGQNLIGPEQSPELGVIRTDELLAARARDGAEQWFTRARDFGYSKSAAETLAIWDHDAILSDVVLVIRRFRPDLIITRFQPGGSGTHGHHTASADLALEAFQAAADPRRFPEQLHDGVTAWQAKRILWNRSNFGPPPKPEELAKLLRQDVGGYNPLLGRSYGEVAAESRSMHKSQGFGVAAKRGESFEYFAHLGGAPAAHSLFDGIDLGWSRVAGGPAIAAKWQALRASFSPAAPEKSVAALLALRREIAAMPDHPWKAHKLDELAALIDDAAGLFSEATVPSHVGVPGGDVAVTVTALNRSSLPIVLTKVHLPGGAALDQERPLPPGTPTTVEQTMRLAPDLPTSQPYWLRLPPERGHWTVADPALIGLPASPPLVAELTFRLGAERWTSRRPLAMKWVDPVAGERQRPLAIVPAVAIEPRSPLLVFAQPGTKVLRVRLKAQRAQVSGELAPSLPAGYHANPPRRPFALAAVGDETEVQFELTAPAAESVERLRLVATVDGQPLSSQVRRIEYAHLPIETLTPPAEVTLLRVDVRHKKTRLGYIRGAGDEVAEALRQVGYEVTLLDEEAIAERPLSRYQAILTGVRAFNVDARLPYLHDALMRYVQEGGTLIVQYNTNNFLSKVPAAIGPRPFTIGHGRVTDEGAEVTLLDPRSPLLHQPNPIGARDFAGWVQERGLYFAETWDELYRPLFAMHDAGEAPERGSVLLARHGKGAFIYTGLAFFRQLPAGVPGAYRLLANFIDHGPF